MLNNHITKPSGKNAPGVGFEVLACPIGDFTLIAEAPDTETTPGEDIVITDDHTHPVGKGFRKIYTTARTGEVNHTQAGDIDSMGMNGEFLGFSPGMNEALFSLLSKDEDLIVLIKDSNCSSIRYWQLGTSCLPAKIMGSEVKSGKAGSTDRKGTNLKIISYADRILIYTGAVTFATQA